MPLLAARGIRMVPAIAFLVIAVGIGDKASAETCPRTCIDPVSVCSTNPSGSTSYQDFRGYSSCSYDLVQGRATVSSTDHCYALVDASDRYVVVGPPIGTPVALTARLIVSGSTFGSCSFSCSGGSVSISLADSGGVPLTFGKSQQSGPISGMLDLSLTKNSGQPFRLDWTLHGSSFKADFNRGLANATATLSFLVPPGVRIQSCSGFLGTVATPALAGSWGSLKIRYR